MEANCLEERKLIERGEERREKVGDGNDKISLCVYMKKYPPLNVVLCTTTLQQFKKGVKQVHIFYTGARVRTTSSFSSGAKGTKGGE